VNTLMWIGLVAFCIAGLVELAAFIFFVFLVVVALLRKDGQ